MRARRELPTGPCRRRAMNTSSVIARFRRLDRIGRHVGASLGVALLLAGAMTACSANDRFVESAGDAARSADATQTASGGGASSDEAAEAAGGSLKATAAATERQRIRTGRIALRVENPGKVAALTERVATLVAEVGGTVERSDLTSGSDASAEMVLRVPPDTVDDTMARLGKVAETVSRSVSVEDVTAQYTDLEGRISALEISTERLRGFLGKAGDAGQIATIEGELTRREADLESMKGQMAVLADQVAAATITVTISAKPPALGESDDGPAGFGSAVASGWRAVRLAFRWAMAVVGVLVPFVPVVAVIALPFVLARRRTVRRRAASVAD